MNSLCLSENRTKQSSLIAEEGGERQNKVCCFPLLSLRQKYLIGFFCIHCAFLVCWAQVLEQHRKAMWLV